MTNTKTTHCPNCGVDIDVNELLYHQLDKQAQQKYQDQIATEQAQLKEQHDALTKQSKELEKNIETQVVSKLAEEKVNLGSEIVRPPRMPLSGDTRAQVLQIIESSIASRPSLPDYLSL